MFNECLIHLFDYTCLHVMYACLTIYGSIQIFFWSFYIFLEVIFITFCVHVWCLLCFSLFKHVLYWKTGVRVFCDSAGDSLVAKPQSRVHPEALVTHSWLTCDSFATCENFRDWTSQLAQSRNAQNQLFKEFFSWETCFKPLPSSFKPLFHYFYIKTQSIWMVFHSFNISKVIINSLY